MGSRDEFTSTVVFHGALACLRGVSRHVVPGVSHFALESPAYDAPIAQLITAWVRGGHSLPYKPLSGFPAVWQFFPTFGPLVFLTCVGLVLWGVLEAVVRLAY